MKNVMLSLHLFIAFMPVCSLGLALFRLSLKTYFLQILLVSFVIANVCLLLNIYEVKYLTWIFKPQLQGNFKKLIYVGVLVFVTTSLTGISFYYTNSVTFIMHLVVLCLFGVAIRRSVLQETSD